ncbi:hypothetical protein GH714_039546 [Hevea brasiliensis]|uniref:CWF21 domain-containing protein n=1 Tax=Hevea brasiliensis TaxID=3981 RepID=A0A6A6KH99_HEVBR|nr:hypothetical protein GH714_039546 [Hevea brasiliensis]
MMVARLLSLEEAEKQRCYELDDDLKFSQSHSSSSKFSSGRRETNVESEPVGLSGWNLYGRMGHLLKAEGKADDETEFATDASVPMQPDSGMNEEQRQKLRRLEVALIEYRESLEERGMKSVEEIERKVAIHRKWLQSEYGLLVSSQDVPGNSNQASEDSPHKTNHSSEQNIILENGKLLNSPKQLSFRRKIDSSRICSCSQPGSPNPRTHKAHPAFHRLTSSSATNPPEKSRVSAKKKPRNLNGTSDKKFDPVIGMSIVMITLIIMLLWGRLCAILCTSAWLYFVPRLAAKVKPTPNGTVKNGLVSGNQI